MSFSRYIPLWLQTLTVLVLLCSQFTARAEPLPGGSLSTENIAARSPGLHRSLCEAGNCGSASKRDYIGEADIDNDEYEEKENGRILTFTDDGNESFSSVSELHRRGLTKISPSKLDGYIKKITNNQRGNLMIPLISDDTTSTSEFRIFENLPFNIGTRDLCGCTCLFLVSNKAVYAAHYYEDLSFQPRGFQKQVKDFLRSPNSWVNGEEQREYTSLQQVKEYFPEATTDAFIMTPAKEIGEDKNGLPVYDTSKAQYKRRLDGQEPYISQLQSIVRDITGVKPEVHVYEAAEKERESRKLDYTVSGRALFQYDPEGPGEVRLFFENRKVLHGSADC